MLAWKYKLEYGIVAIDVLVETTESAFYQPMTMNLLGASHRRMVH